MTNHTFAVCAYGESEYLDQCLQSLVAQTKESRIIICTSTPNELIQSVADRYGCTVFVNHGEAGIAGDWNFAISCVETPFATIAHQDDVYCSDYAELVVGKLEANPNGSLIAFCDYSELRDGEFVDDAAMVKVKRFLLKPLSSGKGSKSPKAKKRALCLGNSICCPAVSFNLTRLSQPLFNKGMRSNLDWDLWERLSRMEGTFEYVPKACMAHRVHDGSETSACIADNVRTKEDYEMLKRFWPTPVAKIINAAYSKAQLLN